jgi:hypothetical protein
MINPATASPATPNLHLSTLPISSYLNDFSLNLQLMLLLLLLLLLLISCTSLPDIARQHAPTSAAHLAVHERDSCDTTALPSHRYAT